MFTGTIRIKVCEACGLRPTDFQKRHNMTFGKPDEQPIDPYVSIDVDENHLGESFVYRFPFLWSHWSDLERVRAFFFLLSGTFLHCSQMLPPCTTRLGCCRPFFFLFQFFFSNATGTWVSETREKKKKKTIGVGNCLRPKIIFVCNLRFRSFLWFTFMSSPGFSVIFHNSPRVFAIRALLFFFSSRIGKCETSMADFPHIHSQKSAHVMNARQVDGTRVYAFGHFPILYVYARFVCNGVCLCVSLVSTLDQVNENFHAADPFSSSAWFFRFHFHFRIETGAQSNTYANTHTQTNICNDTHPDHRAEFFIEILIDNHTQRPSTQILRMYVQLALAKKMYELYFTTQAGSSNVKWKLKRDSIFRSVKFVSYFLPIWNSLIQRSRQLWVIVRKEEGGERVSILQKNFHYIFISKT